MKRTWLGFIVEFLEEHFFLNEFFDPGKNHQSFYKYRIIFFLDKLPGNRFYNDFADLVDKRAQIIFPGITVVHTKFANKNKAPHFS